MKYTKKQAEALLAGVRKAIYKKWKPLSSGKFKGRCEPGCALCRVMRRLRGMLDCLDCPMYDSRGRECREDGHVYIRWGDRVEESPAGVSFKVRANKPAAVKVAKRVLASLLRAEKRLVKRLEKAKE